MSPGPRIVSLLPSATEIVCRLGLGERLVGRSHECDFPAGLGHLPPLTRPRLDVEAASPAIDTGVKRLVEQGLSVYEVDAERLRQLRPDVVVTQTQCEVCAVTPADLAAALATWTGARPVIVSLAAARLAEVWASVEEVALALGVAARGRRVRAELEERCRGLAARAGPGHPQPTVACIEWVEPLMAAGNWVPELVELAGGESLFAAPGQHSPWLEPEGLAAADPDVVVVMPCGLSLARTRAETERSHAQSPWLPRRALARGTVALTDGHHYFNRPGPRLVDSLAILGEIVGHVRATAGDPPGADLPPSARPADWEWRRSRRGRQRLRAPRSGPARSRRPG